jgi:hypothetical protein
MYSTIWKSAMFLVARNNFGSTMIVAMTPSENGVKHIEHRPDGGIGGGLDIMYGLEHVNNEEIGDHILDVEFTGHEYSYCRCAENAHLIPE